MDRWGQGEGKTDGARERDRPMEPGSKWVNVARGRCREDQGDGSMGSARGGLMDPEGMHGLMGQEEGWVDLTKEEIDVCVHEER